MNVHERLTEAARLVKEREKWLHRREITGNLIQEQKNLRDQLQRQLALESRDVERLDGITLLNLWHSLRGTKEEAKRKEQEEYLTAKLKYDEANAALIALEAELTRMDNNLAAMGDLDTKYQEAVRDKEEYLLRSGGSEARDLFEMAEQLGCLKAEEKELLEAIEAGRKVEKAFSKVQKSLGSAEGWGAFDLLGGGLITTAIKHSHISDARNEIDQAQLLLRQFQRELTDVKPTNDTIQIGGLATFADFFLDGLLFDAIVQFKINDAQARTKQLQLKVQGIIHDLNVMKEQNSQRLLDLDQERRQIIENTK
ncbi:MAG: hypothetical protein CVU90_04230 [Firmicutes bacterium HGW-Firmicutes-15]|nr:MAG: hypothetical protein CVU90_04230 [Firmicutes bacterium HGW-Firmicutes-15]